MENKRYCEQRGIRLSGRGRSSKISTPAVTTEQKEIFKSDHKKRSVIEGRIGTSKRKYGLDLILTKLVETSRSVISMALFALNAEKILRLIRLVLDIFLWLCQVLASVSRLTASERPLLGV